MQRPSRRWHARRGAAAILGLVSFFIAGSRGEEPSRGGPDDLARYDARIKAEDREHWAFQPVASPRSRRSRTRPGCRNPIDAFVLAELEAQGLDARAAGRAARRCCGGSPRPDRPAADARGAATRSCDDPSPEALDRGRRRAARPPAYGERWGRHWLDLVRYRRDQRLRARRHQAERLAVPRLRDPRASTTTSPTTASSSSSSPATSCPTRATRRSSPPASTGSAPGTTSRPTRSRTGSTSSTTWSRTTSEVFLGLTLACARCHDHKFEPLSALDYYRMVAIFDPLQRPVDGRTELDLPAGSPAEVAAEAERDRQIEAIDAGSPSGATPGVELPAVRPEQAPREAVEAFRVEPSRRTEAQKRSSTITEGARARLAATLPEEDGGHRRRRGGDQRLRAARPTCRAATSCASRRRSRR